jgi:serine/threonine-protein kinase
MVVNKIDGIEFRLKRKVDFSWLNKHGKAFSVIDQTGSGCLCVGMKDKDNKYFCKIAGVDTIEAEVPPQEAVNVLKNSVQLYQNLKYPNLIEIVDEYVHNEFYIVVYKWAEGECLFDHWNFELYKNDSSLRSPAERFKKLDINRKLKVVDEIFKFMINVSEHEYVAVDFYDGSIMYDFEKDKTTFCDIDFFRKSPVSNDMGSDWYGTKRLKSPEEYIFGETINEATNVFTIGALIFDFFGDFNSEDIMKRYKDCCFYACSPEKWTLNQKCYSVVVKATQNNRENRYQKISEFHAAWNEACKEMR